MVAEKETGFKIYPIGTVVTLGEDKGIVTGITFRGKEMLAMYLVTIHSDGSHSEICVYDYEMNSKSEKVNFRVSVF
jgi:hypothetical protein